jgi:hypothetical protein
MIFTTKLKTTKKSIIQFCALVTLGLIPVDRLLAQGFALNISGSRADTSAMLDVSSTSKGFLPPRMTIAQRNAILSPAQGLQIFQTDSLPGMYYYNGIAWVGAASNTTWGLKGNSGTIPAINFIGTTDNNPLRLKTNNVWAGELNPSTGNASFGTNAGLSATNGYSNVAIGNGALKSNTTIGNLVAVGDSALFNINGGTGWNTAVGSKALYANTTGSNNTALGYNTLKSNTSGTDNTAAGIRSLQNNTSGNYNTAYGSNTLLSNTTGTSNSAFGLASLQNSTTASYCSAFGVNSLQVNNGSYNTAIGVNSLLSSTSSSYNTATGVNSLAFTTTGVQNSAFGVSTLESNTTGGYNTAIGINALYTNTTGNNNTAIGYAADCNSGNLTNATAVGNAAIVNASNKVVIGNTSVTVIGGQVGWSTFSDGRFKSNIVENVPGLDFIMKLKPVTYHFDARKFEHFLGNTDSKLQKQGTDLSSSESMVHSGFIAQDVEKAAQELGYDFSGVHKPVNEKDNYSLAYGEFTVPLVKAVQELKKQLNEQIQLNKELKAELAEKDKTMNARLEALEELAHKGKVITR